jgi:CRISPR-associated exonuclease Cas4
MNILLIIAIIFVVFGVLILFVFKKKKQTFPFPVDKVLYSDSADNKGTVIISDTIPLVGKPDYIVKIKKDIIPVEVKRGKTPHKPYPNHLAQVFAYCYLVEEQYGKRPPYGIISYPQEYFRVDFEKGTEKNIERLVEELIQKKHLKERAITTMRICKSCRDHMSM